MAKYFDRLEPSHIDFIGRQRIFFIASSQKGKEINLSPRGVMSFKALDENKACYIDFHGSGNRTAEDIAEGSGITVMFCSFSKDPLILRLFCDGSVIRPGEPGFDDKVDLWDPPDRGKVRQVFVFNIRQVQTSCGYGVPVYEYVGEKESAKKLTG